MSFVQPHQQVGNRRFTNPARSQNGEPFSGSHPKTHILKNGTIPIIRKRHLAKLDLSSHLRWGFSLSTLLHVIFTDIQKFKNSIERYSCTFDTEVQIHQRLQRAECPRLIRRKCYQCTDRHLSVDDEVTPIEGRQRTTDERSRRRNRTSQIRQHLKASDDTDKLLAQGTELAELEVLHCKQLNELDRGQRFNQERRQRSI